MKPPDSQTSSASLVEVEETPQNVERCPDACEPTAERDTQMEY
jgi:hypothetical protein